MSDYDPVLQWLEEQGRQKTEKVRQMLYAEGRPDLVAEFDQRIRDINSGVSGARNAWHSISAAQRATLTVASAHGGRMERVGKEYRHRDRHQPYRPVYVATIRNLCAHELMAWDGGAFDPEAAAVVTERGHFVLKHGSNKARTP